MAFFKDELQHIKGMVFDVDGVFTNGRIYVSGDGYQTRSMNVKDGYSIHYAHKKGYYIGVITGGKCPSIRQRFNDLSIEDVYIASSNKMKDLEAFMTKHNLSFDEILYM